MPPEPLSPSPAPAAARQGHTPNPHVPIALKIVVAGGFGAGKTTLVGAVSEIPPLTTEEHLTAAGAGIDSLTGVDAKTTTTVAMDFGRITLTRPQPMTLFLFGTPGQDRFLFTWDDLAYGAIGAVVLIDTRRLADSFHAIDYFDQRGTPFVAAVNQFEGARHHYSTDEIRDALDLAGEVPVLVCDARDRHSAGTVLMALVQHAVTRAHSPFPAGGPAPCSAGTSAAAPSIAARPPGARP